MADSKQAVPSGKKSASGCPFSGPRFPKATRDVTSKNMDGISDLVVWAPIKEGFIDAFGNVTYASRLRIVAEALNKLRKNVREFQFSETFADPTKRILSLLDFRIGVVERDIYGFGSSDDPDCEKLRPRQYMYLTATFDGPWEPYMRQIWRPMGPFLDLILCNCDTYPVSTRTDFEDYIDWVRKHLLDTGMFYLVMGQTVKDHLYLKQTERYEREIEDAHKRDIAITTHTVPSPESEASDVRAKDESDAMRLALEALNVLYQLTRLYPADLRRDGQGELLWRATRVILEQTDIKGILEETKAKHPVERERQKAAIILNKLKDQLTWYDEAYGPIKRCPTRDAWPAENGQVQKGILTSYDDGLGRNPITHAAMLLLKITCPYKARLFLHPVFWSWEGHTYPFFRNLAFTYSGLEKMPLGQAELMAFPKEFREGMEDRAPMLGDMHHNHPQRWTLPPRNGQPEYEDKNLPPVSLDEVDLVVQLRGVLGENAFDDDEEIYVKFEDSSERDREGSFSSVDSDTLSFETFIDKTYQAESTFVQLPDNLGDLIEKLYNEIAKTSTVRGGKAQIEGFIRFVQEHGDVLGVELLSIQSSYRPGATKSAEALFPITNPTTINPFVQHPTPIDHFGFRDGISQPVITDLDFNNEKKIKDSAPMEVRHGDIVVGFSNLLGDVQRTNRLKKIQRNGSFLALRKMRQDVGAFEGFLAKNGGKTKADQDALAGKLMGRNRDGSQLIKSTIVNHFDYKSDKNGLKCPFVSHIRRVNPRYVTHGRKSPKIVRRGMTYGDRFTKPDTEDRGVIFMAYCANLAEQFETIQRWVNGGNSTNIGSAQVDPIVAPPPANGHDVVKFPEKEECDDSGKTTINIRRLHRDPQKPFVQLEWGAYAFTPGLDALRQLYDDLTMRKKVNTKLIDSVARGKSIVKGIEALPSSDIRSREWKILLEDFMTKDPSEHAITSDVWAYIRQDCDGVYRIEDGIEGHEAGQGKKPVILVVDKNKIHDVLKDPQRFSVSEIGYRLKTVFAEHYIGMDPDLSLPQSKDPYYVASSVTNEELYKVKASPAFNLAYNWASYILDNSKWAAQTLFKKSGEPPKFKIELTREFFAPALAALCSQWFGLPDGKFFESGAFLFDHVSNDIRPARCPGDFLGPSRGSFYPRPTPAIWDYANSHGQKLLTAINDLTGEWQKKKAVQGSVSKKIHKQEKDFDLLGRNIVGAMIGMLPSSEATLRMVTKDWLDEGVFWRLQGHLLSQTNGTKPTYVQAQEALEASLIEGMSKRPAPDLLYRTATQVGVLGDQPYNEGDTIIVSLISAMEADLEKGRPDINTVFGGPREGGKVNKTGIAHACPAKDMAMGALLGILSALMSCGRIQALSASLIVEISDWTPLTEPPKPPL